MCLSAALSASGKVRYFSVYERIAVGQCIVCVQVFVWGLITLQDYIKPFETNLRSLDEVFSVYGDGTMYRTLKIGNF